MAGGPGSYVLGAEERKEVLDVLDGGNLFRYGTPGVDGFQAKVVTFENEMAERLGHKHVVATSSGTGSLMCCLAALGIGMGDEVIVPGYTFIASIATIAMSGIGDMNAWQLAAIALVAVGVVALGITEATEDDELRAARQQVSNHKYAKSLLALLLPIAYCILDAAGTFADSLVLETLNEDSANVAYELTFLAAGLVCGAYVLFVKREKLTPRTEAPKYIGAVCETIGQFFYIYALADSAHVAMSAPIISSYCAASVLWSRVFLKEKLSVKHYISILMVFIGIVIMGVFDV